ncbi:Cholecystokinin [Labeo rohita]|uniref:Cholecystokinin n=1 Tax=Labeo rohita TaxID=84645 RepID=A0ABQ8KZQ1_LABRO|nr:Cholecystokinin [Labeo rohita]
MRTSCVWVFELVLLMVWTSETQTTAQASPISERHNVTGLTNTLPIPENNPPLSPETPTSRPKDTQHPAQGHPPSDPRTPTSRPKDTHLPAQGHPPHGPRTPTSRPKDTHLPVQRLPPPDPRTPSSRSKDTHLPAKGQPPPGQRTATSHRLKDRDYLGWMDFGVGYETCCFNFIDFKIPATKTVSALKTGLHCPVAGIVQVFYSKIYYLEKLLLNCRHIIKPILCSKMVMTQKDLEFCVNPDEPWIKKEMQKLPGK